MWNILLSLILQTRPDGEPLCLQDRDEEELPASQGDRLSGSDRPGHGVHTFIIFFLRYFFIYLTFVLVLHLLMFLRTNFRESFFSSDYNFSC